ncbi:hypothetical protein M4D52_29995 [Paenibacillus lactis]|uniref:hypothetical protein n=1 Tax=Paenibacillus lactis TaxID=228574 RepID=UPI00203C6BAB|nr:hypothetical protein [Paenibacillus lactis]MCM3497670.1 hypothetical protein [Paenibacillus lactis]
MTVTISHDEEFTIIKYADGKRPIKIEPFVIETLEDADILEHIIRFIQRESNSPHHIAKMEESKFYALVERLATMICYAYSPKANLGISKTKIRGIVLFTLQAAIAAGEWPESYKMTDTTFVQYGGGRT